MHVSNCLLFALFCGCEISHLYVVYTQFLNARAQGTPVLLLLCQTKLARPVVTAHCLYPPSAFAKVLIIHPSYMFKPGGWHLWDYCTDHPGARESCVGVSGAAAITLFLAHREIHLRFWALPLNRVTLCCSGSIFIRQRTDWQQLNTRQYLWVGWRTSK